MQEGRSSIIRNTALKNQEVILAEKKTNKGGGGSESPSSPYLGTSRSPDVKQLLIFATPFSSLQNLDCNKRTPTTHFFLRKRTSLSTPTKRGFGKTSPGFIAEKKAPVENASPRVPYRCH